MILLELHSLSHQSTMQSALMIIEKFVMKVNSPGIKPDGKSHQWYSKTPRVWKTALN
jgi:hypothetical protein